VGLTFSVSTGTGSARLRSWEAAIALLLKRMELTRGLPRADEYVYQHLEWREQWNGKLEPWHPGQRRDHLLQPGRRTECFPGGNGGFDWSYWSCSSSSAIHLGNGPVSADAGRSILPDGQETDCLIFL
jgi:hypothetical protein